MLRTTLGSLLVNEALPVEMRDYSGARKLDSKGVKALLQEIAEKHPGDYRQVSKRLLDIGRSVAQSSGSFSFGLKHLRQSPAYTVTRQRLEAEMEKIMDSDLPDDDKQKRTLELVGKEQKSLEDAIYQEAQKGENPLALQVLSGTRGKPMNLKSLLGADLLYQDHRDRLIPVPVLRSYSQGLSPAEYFAGAFGARRGVVDVKQATQDAGFFGKQFVQALHRLIVTKLDADEDPIHQMRGLPVSTDDPDSEGSLLSFPVGGYPRNTTITPKILKDLQGRGFKRMVVRSPLVGGPPEGGVYGRDVGVREKGTIAPIGDQVGIAGGQAITEPISQSGLSSKHSGGVAGASKGVTGFKYLNCLAAGTEVRMADGSVKRIEDISAGEEVLGSDGRGFTFSTRVLAQCLVGTRECITATFRIGSSRDFRRITSTPDHKILATRNVTRNKKVFREIPHQRRVGEKTSYPFSAQLADGYCDKRKRREPLALLIGLLLGDGCFSGSNASISLACADNTMMEDIDNYLSSLLLKATSANVGLSYWITQKVKKLGKSHARGGRWATHPVKKWLMDNGLWGLTCESKFIPACVEKWDNVSVAELLAGLIASDGCIFQLGDGKSWGFHFTVTSRPLTVSFKDLLERRFGIYGTPVNEVKLEHNKKAKLPAWGVRYTADNVVKKLSRVLNIPGVKKTRAEKILAKPRSKHNRDNARANRVSMSPAGSLEVYDLYVDNPEHLFVLANGLVVSNSMIQVPKTFPGGASHAEKDGRIDHVDAAPAGGLYVTIDGQRHYVSPGFDLKVKVGDHVEAGDVLSDGIPNPSKIVEHKGVGEGRRYFVDAFRAALKESGISSHRRNLELVARGFINHVRMTDELGPHSPDDVVGYDQLEHSWEPREGTKKLSLSSAIGKYLEKPILHHTIGTKIRPSMLQDFKDFGIKDLEVHDEPPPFQPEMIRGMENLQHDPDWLTRMLGSHLEKGLLKGVQRGDVSDEKGTSFVPSLANPGRFGREGLVRGFKAAPAPSPTMRPASVLDGL